MARRVLRAKIDMAAPNINLRDPVMYRIMHTAHHRTGDAWCIYPMYDWAHGQSDAIEGVTHSLCSDEFTNNRPLYDLVHRKTRHLPLAPNRVCPRQHHLHRPLQAIPSSAHRAESRLRLGRSSALHPARSAPLGVPTGGHPPLLDRSRHCQTRQQHRHLPPRILHPRPAQPDRAPAHGRAQPAQGSN